MSTRSLRARLNEASYDGEGINVNDSDVIALLEALHAILRGRHCDAPACTHRACCQAAIARTALQNAGEEI